MVPAERRPIWSAVAERSGDTALERRNPRLKLVDPKRRPRFALPAHSKTLSQTAAHNVVQSNQPHAQSIAIDDREHIDL